MKASKALLALAELTSYQWGMVTSAQAGRRGVTRLNLSRLAEAGHLIRLAHGVYLDAGAPGDRHTDLRAAWLSADPARLAEERLADGARGVVIAGASAARLHGIGDLPAARHDFVCPQRRQSQRSEIRYRKRNLDPRDLTLVEGLPVMTVERTITDLVEDIKELSLVADVLRDASEGRSPDAGRLEELLAPLAERNGFPRADGGALLNRLKELAGTDLKTVAREIALAPELGALVAASFAESHPHVDLAAMAASGPR
ncbi:type IV toxin-antitoxin system AbiEi family antitoxin domain-containing protein [Jiangella anatolica]|uniref:Transcriptional regulator n=1 Tax=Jiangella anatolica TaxID=2670374 RepID=A0A2W2BM87_9ACTN|nr:type IV toxin-antitoxin system AbiEi family antitoxin domain-containing protein [Jiangella anatolica]PZF86440.1 transcriptional regulator [Jiangella anatolica]